MQIEEKNHGPIEKRNRTFVRAWCPNLRPERLSLIMNLIVAHPLPGKSAYEKRKDAKGAAVVRLVQRSCFAAEVSCMAFAHVRSWWKWKTCSGRNRETIPILEMKEWDKQELVSKQAKTPSIWQSHVGITQPNSSQIFRMVLMQPERIEQWFGKLWLTNRAILLSCLPNAWRTTFALLRQWPGWAKAAAIHLLSQPLSLNIGANEVHAMSNRIRVKKTTHQGFSDFFLRIWKECVKLPKPNIICSLCSQLPLPIVFLQWQNPSSMLMLLCEVCKGGESAWAYIATDLLNLGLPGLQICLSKSEVGLW